MANDDCNNECTSVESATDNRCKLEQGNKNGDNCSGANATNNNASTESVNRTDSDNSVNQFKIAVVIEMPQIPAVISRMVLDPKSTTSHNDYGSIHSQQDILPHSLLSPHTSLPLPDVSSTVEEESLSPSPVEDKNRAQQPSNSLVVGLSNGNDPTSNMTQRQPLLPTPLKDNMWTKNDGSLVMSKGYFDEDSDSDERNITSPPNGIIKIDMPAPTREEPRFPKEKWKTFIASIVVFVNFLFTTCSLALVHERVPDRTTYSPLPDVVLDLIPPQDWALNVSEVLIMISLNTAFVFLLFHKHRFIVFRRIFLILSLLYFMRSVTIYVTVLPIASKTYYCSPKANGTSAYIVITRVLQLVSGFGLSINGKHTYCGDYIYSGHTVMLVLSYLVISEYSPKKFFLLHWLVWLIALTGIVMVLVAHGHYTIDVIVAYYVTTRLFWTYHTLCNNPYLKNPTPLNYIGREWWFPFFRYFEKNVGGVVPRQYDWPLPWPRRFLAKHPNRNS